MLGQYHNMVSEPHFELELSITGINFLNQLEFYDRLG